VRAGVLVTPSGKVEVNKSRWTDMEPEAEDILQSSVPASGYRFHFDESLVHIDTGLSISCYSHSHSHRVHIEHMHKPPPTHLYVQS